MDTRSGFKNLQTGVPILVGQDLLSTSQATSDPAPDPRPDQREYLAILLNKIGDNQKITGKPICLITSSSNVKRLK